MPDPPRAGALLKPGGQARKMINRLKTVVSKINKTSTKKIRPTKVGLHKTAKFSHLMSTMGQKAHIVLRTKQPKHGQKCERRRLKKWSSQ